MDDLLPCPNPWCIGHGMQTPKVETRFIGGWKNGVIQYHATVCFECDFRGPHGKTNAEASKAWNTRPTPNLKVWRFECKCHDCGREYGKPGFPDLVIPHNIWNKISPTGDGGGLLCPSCLCARLEIAGIETIGDFKSGPLCNPDFKLAPAQSN